MKNKFYDYASLDGDRLKNHNENLHKNSAVIPNIDLANGSSSYILHFFLTVWVNIDVPYTSPINAKRPTAQCEY